MAEYRLYFLDTEGHIRGAQDFEFSNDIDAIEGSRALGDPRAMELWERDRRVSVFPANDGVTSSLDR